MKKREISDIEKEECKLLKQLFNDRKKELGLSQAKIAGLIGVTQAAINHYLNGTNALNASIASEFAKYWAFLSVALAGDWKKKLTRCQTH